MQVSSARVASSEASEATRVRRSHMLAVARSYINGGDESVQLQSQLKILTQEEREKVLADAHLPIVIPVNHALAMKADLALPWAKLRYGRAHLTKPLTPRWLKTFNISLASERKLAKDFTGENYKVENMPFSFTVDRKEVIKSQT